MLNPNVIIGQGCSNIVIVVNKMDMTEPAWSEDRYNSISSDIRALLESLQFPASSIRSIPVSGLTGVNLTSTPVSTGKSSAIGAALSVAETCPWYTGPTLLEVMDALPVALVAHSDKPASLRAIVSSVMDTHKSCEANIKVLRGRLRIGQTVGFLGGAEGVATVKSIRSGDSTQHLTVLREREQGLVTLVDRYCYVVRSAEDLG